jgi:hypothetical protein
MVYNFIEIEFSNAERYRIPLLTVHQNRCRYYADSDGISYEEALKNEEWALSDSFELQDWLRNNMDWTDVKDVAVLQTGDKPFNYKAEFVNAEVRIG